MCRRGFRLLSPGGRGWTASSATYPGESRSIKYIPGSRIRREFVLVLIGAVVELDVYCQVTAPKALDLFFLGGGVWVNALGLHLRFEDVLLGIRVKRVFRYSSAVLKGLTSFAFRRCDQPRLFACSGASRARSPSCLR